MISLISTKDKIDEKKYKEFINEDSRISFYGDFLYPLAMDSTYDNYLTQAAEGTINKKLLACRNKIWEKLNGFSMKTIKLAPAYFIHYGTTKELFSLLTKNLNNYRCLNWREKVLSNVNDKISYIVNHSYIDDNTKICKNVYIENSYIGKDTVIGDNVILSNVKLGSVQIPDNVCLNTILTRNNEYVTRIYGLEDNPKIEKSNKTIFLGCCLEDMLNKYDINENKIWQKEDKSIWKAKLYTVENNNNASVKSALLLYKIINCEAKKEEAVNYFNKKRTSLYESFNNADATKMKNNNKKIEDLIISYEFINLIKEEKNIELANNVLLKNENIEAQIQSILNIANKYDYKIKSRIYLALSKIIKINKLENKFKIDFEEKCYEEIKNVISKQNTTEAIKQKNIKNKSIEELPIRINFGGGWSDTPPYCNENGGIVLNGAFKINGENPIKVKIEKNKNREIILKSKDLNIIKKFDNIEELKKCNNTNDVFSLLKASLLISGIINKDDNSINNVIDRIGSGFIFTTDATLIPKGSGLGTSSILAAGCLKCLYNFLGISISDEELAYKTLEQEQIMGTGGGWQDQIGGIIPGIKCTYTEPGEIQSFDIRRINISSKFKNEINNRMVLIYTGQRRLAKNLLRDIMNNYIANNRNTVETIGEIKNKAIQMQKAFEKENLKLFCKLLNEHWELSKKLDKGCTNTCINQILNCCDDLIDGRMICGAGGGGFLYVILKKGISKKALSNRIQEIFQDSGIKVFNIEIYEGDSKK